jgi:hypothetical protein
MVTDSPVTSATLPVSFMDHLRMAGQRGRFKPRELSQSGKQENRNRSPDEES